VRCAFAIGTSLVGEPELIASERPCSCSRVRPAAGQPLAHRVHDLPRGRHQSEDHERSAIDGHGAIDEDFVFSVMPVDHVDFETELAAEARRHTDGMEAGDSERAVTNRYPSHGGSLLGCRCLCRPGLRTIA
jgi:hypothetical protein